MSQEDQGQERKIVVDEDWKAQAQAEKETLQREMRAKQAAPAEEGPLPPPSLELLATSLGMQAMVALGLIANPATGKMEVHLEQAKHLIDTLQMLLDKTQGNRTADETDTLDRLLHELRLGYLAVQEKAKAEGAG